MPTYLVGGAVRDKLLELPVKDRDWVVVGSTPEQMEAKGFQAVGKDFPVFLHPETKEEYALARTERKTAKGYQGFAFYTAPDVTLEDDLIRRDLTINALAEDENGAIIDPFNGQSDLNNRVLRHVSPAFQEDPVRILRIARFKARFHHLGFTIADETMSLMKQMVQAGEVDALVAERVWQELEKTLGEPNPEAFIQVLRDCGALAVLFPELDRLFGIPQPPQHHPEIDTGIHTLMVLQQAIKLSADKTVRFAALVHDLGKGVTPEHVLPHHYGHEEQSAKLVIALCERYRVPKHYRQIAEHVARYHTHVHKAFELRPKTLLKVIEAVTQGYRQPENLPKVLLACEADARGRTGYEDRNYPQVDYYLQLQTATQDVDVQAIIANGFHGEGIKEEIRRERLRRIAKIRKEVAK
jgi:tRNA nucleotidyltransferase (CCA-adding enzyme)